MNEDDLKIMVISKIKSNIEGAGEDECELNGATQVLADVPNFDSLRFLEVLTDLEVELGISVEIEDLFAKKNGKETIDEIVANLFETVNRYEHDRKAKAS